MRFEDVSWIGPPEKTIAKRRSTLGELERERELFPDIIDALERGNRRQAFAIAKAFSKKTRKIVEAGPVSAVEARLAKRWRYIPRCRFTLTVGDDVDLHQSLVAQIPTFVPPSGSPRYDRPLQASLQYRANGIEADWDQIVLTAKFETARATHTYELDWTIPHDVPAAHTIASDVEASVPDALFAQAQQAARDELARRGLGPYERPGAPAWRLRAPMRDSEFVGGAHVQWRIVFTASGPRRGATVNGVWFGEGTDYEFSYDPAGKDVRIEERGWIT